MPIASHFHPFHPSHCHRWLFILTSEMHYDDTDGISLSSISSMTKELTFCRSHWPYLSLIWKFSRILTLRSDSQMRSFSSNSLSRSLAFCFSPPSFSSILHMSSLLVLLASAMVCASLSTFARRTSRSLKTWLCSSAAFSATWSKVHKYKYQKRWT